MICVSSSLGSDPQFATGRRHIRSGVESYSDDALQHPLPSLNFVSHRVKAGEPTLVEWLSSKSKHDLNNPQERFRKGMQKYVRARVRNMDGARKKLGIHAYDIAHDAVLDVWETPVRYRLSSLCDTAIRHDLMNELEKQARWARKR